MGPNTTQSAPFLPPPGAFAGLLLETLRTQLATPLVSVTESAAAGLTIWLFGGQRLPGDTAKSAISGAIVSATVTVRSTTVVPEPLVAE